MAIDAYLLSQIFAAVAFGFGIVAFQCTGRRRILVCKATQMIFYGVHFVALGRHGAAALMAVNAARDLTALRTTRRSVAVIFILLAVVGFLATVTHPLGYLGLVAVIFGSIGSFAAREGVMRLMYMTGCSLWLAHNILLGSPVAILMEACFLASQIVGLWRFQRRTAK